jgi:hypothetical protein
MNNANFTVKHNSDSVEDENIRFGVGESAGQFAETVYFP